jgi:hypothetical protein
MVLPNPGNLSLPGSLPRLSLARAPVCKVTKSNQRLLLFLFMLLGSSSLGGAMEDGRLMRKRI